MSYLLDVHWGKIEPERRLVPFLAYSSFFPQIVAGPIQRADSFLPQVERADPPRFPTVILGVQRILLGFFKKFVVADNIGAVVNYLYAHLTGDPGAPVLLAFYGYPLQMYADFSGLTDIAVGASLLFGIESPENFNAPFSAPSPSEYWRRWHMTLTTWLTDYVFTPLRMSVRQYGNAGLVFSLAVNMTLIGLWHGFKLTFALFGLVHALYLSVDALTAKARKRYYKTHPAMDRLTNWIGPVITFHLVAIAFVFFRADGVSGVAALFANLFAGFGAFSPEFQRILEGPARALPFMLAAYALMEYLDYLRRRNARGELVISLPRWGRWSVYSCTAVSVVFLLLMLLAAGQNRNPFLYAVF
jgi:D-alanyl-lipoteichoic acid acyltransferase DltB (MBOAT superfamily)